MPRSGGVASTRGDGYRGMWQGDIRVYRLCVVSPAAGGCTRGIAHLRELDQLAASAISLLGGLIRSLPASFQRMLYTTALGEYVWDIDDRWGRSHEQRTKWVPAGLFYQRAA